MRLALTALFITFDFALDFAFLIALSFALTPDLALSVFTRRLGLS